jgi:TctA family transporter
LTASDWTRVALEIGTILLASIYSGSEYGGRISSILLNAPAMPAR